jgi:rRNA maturation RNase YbeY
MIRVRVFNAHPRFRERCAGISHFARSVLRGEGGRNAELNIIFIGDRAMLRLNGTFLRHYYQTDVISFPLAEHPAAMEGEVYVNLDQARRQARRYRETIRSEVARLVAHGVLHLAGYRDHSVPERRAMNKREEVYLKRIRNKR